MCTYTYQIFTFIHGSSWEREAEGLKDTIRIKDKILQDQQVLQCVAVCCSVLQFVTVYCSV